MRTLHRCQNKLLLGTALAVPILLSHESAWAQASATLEEITVEGSPRAVASEGSPSAAATNPDGSRETAFSPVVGYKASRSATGTKTDTPLRDIPQSIQVVPRQVIEDQGAVEGKDVLRNVSGVQYEGDAGGRGSTYTVRGFETFQTATNGLLNNQNFGSVGSRDLVDVERVEVLKGPASVLYGQTTPGGLINFVTKRPTATPYYATELFGGSYGYFRSTIDASAPLTEDGALRYRLNAAYDRIDSFRDYFIPSERLTVAPVVTWQVSPDTAVTAELFHSEQTRQFDRGFVAFGNRVPHIPLGRYLGEPYNTTNSNFTEGRITVDHTFNDEWALRVRGRASRGYAFTPGYAASLEDDGRTVDRFGFTAKDGFLDQTLQGEVTGHFTTGFLAHTVFFGVEGNKSSRTNGGAFYDMPSIDLYGSLHNEVISNYTPFALRFSRLSTISGYAQDQVDLGLGFKLLVGGRYDSTDQINGSFDTTAVRQDSAAFTPRVGLVWQPLDIVALYASYSESFLPQAGQTRAGAGLAPETGQQYEAGVKFDLLDSKLSATFAAFDITKQNVATSDPIDPSFVVLTGEQRSRGFEVDVAGQLTKGWSVIASGAYIDAIVTKDNSIPVGNRLFNVPRFSGSLWSAYEIKEGDWSGLGFGLGVFALGRRYGDLENSFTVPGYARLDAALWYRFDTNTRFQINVKNLLNTRYIDAASNRNNIFPGDPFTVLASVLVKF